MLGGLTPTEWEGKASECAEVAAIVSHVLHNLKATRRFILSSAHHANAHCFVEKSPNSAHGRESDLYHAEIMWEGIND